MAFSLVFGGWGEQHRQHQAPSHVLDGLDLGEHVDLISILSNRLDY